MTLDEYLTDNKIENVTRLEWCRRSSGHAQGPSLLELFHEFTKDKERGEATDAAI